MTGASVKLLKLDDVCRMTGLKKSSIYSFQNNGTFPHGIKLSGRAVAWKESDVQDWIKGLRHIPTPTEVAKMDGATRSKKTTVDLRNYFAGKALQGLLSNPKMQDEILKRGGCAGGWIEDSAFGWADSMLERVK